MSDAALELLQQISARLERIEAKPPSIDDYSVDDVISTAELAALLRLSPRAALRWAARWGVRSSGNDRWPVHRIRAGLHREGMQGGRKPRKERAA